MLQRSQPEVLRLTSAGRLDRYFFSKPKFDLANPSATVSLAELISLDPVVFTIASYVMAGRDGRPPLGDTSNWDVRVKNSFWIDDDYVMCTGQHIFICQDNSLPGTLCAVTPLFNTPALDYSEAIITDPQAQKLEACDNTGVDVIAVSMVNFTRIAMDGSGVSFSRSLLPELNGVQFLSSAALGATIYFAGSDSTLVAIDTTAPFDAAAVTILFSGGLEFTTITATQSFLYLASGALLWTINRVCKFRNK